ncbi:MAG: PilN domain-containing protein [Halothiobacillaceae bacterium]|nr:PilN domain-containing protein [Halothiobacillaceae bacterium]
MPRINLLPWREALRKKRQKDFVTHAGLAFIGAASIALLAHVTVQGQVNLQIERNTYLKGVVTNLDKKIEEIQSLKKQRDALVARMGAIEKLQSTRSLIVRLFEELARTTPEGIVLTNVSMGEEASTVQISGFSDTTARVAEYLRSLNKSGLLDSAEIIGEGILAKDSTAAGKSAIPKKTQTGFDGKFAFSIKAIVTPSATTTDVEGSSESSKP